MGGGRVLIFVSARKIWEGWERVVMEERVVGGGGGMGMEMGMDGDGERWGRSGMGWSGGEREGRGGRRRGGREKMGKVRMKS